MNREPGFYFVLFPYDGYSKWEPARYFQLGFWEVIGDSNSYDEDYFLDIDPTPIKRKEQ